MFTVTPLSTSTQYIFLLDSKKQVYSSSAYHTIHTNKKYYIIWKLNSGCWELTHKYGIIESRTIGKAEVNGIENKNVYGIDPVHFEIKYMGKAQVAWMCSIYVK